MQQQIQTIKNETEAMLIAKLAREIWQEHYTPIIGDEQVAYMLRKFQSADRIWTDINEKGYTYCWISTEGRPAAYMAYQEQKDQNKCFLSKLYVKKPYRGQKMARALMAHLVNTCRQHNIHEIYLTVNKNNNHSIEAYKKMMFQVYDAVITDIGQGFVMDDYVMHRII